VIVEDLNKVPLFTPRWGDAPVVALVHHLFGWTAFREASLPVAAMTVFLERLIPKVYRGLPAVAVSESTRDDLVRRGLGREDIEVIPNGIDLDVYGPGEAERTPAPTLLYMGRLKRYKGVDLCIRAVRELRDGGVDVTFRIAGKGDDEGRLRALVDRLGVSDRVEFLGFVSDQRKLDLLQTSWVHLLTSPKEGWGIANIEAAACGTPTIASDAPGLRESVRDGETGYLVPHGDVSALAGKIRTLVENVELRERLGEGAIRFASGYSWDRSAARWEALLEPLVLAPSRGAR
jgi:glycosyltransferase involved in cell wall biosynthesis